MGPPAPYLRLAIALGLFASLSLQQNYTAPCRIRNHQSCIVDNKLYIDGGLVYRGSNTDNAHLQNNTYLIWEDLGTALDSEQNGLAKNSDVPSVYGGALWPDETNRLFYLYGGSYYHSSAPASFQLWYFDTLHNTWNATTAGNGQDQIQPATYGAGAVDSSGHAYYLGGYLNNQSGDPFDDDVQMSSNMIAYDMNANSWSVVSTGSVRRAEGVLLYVPVSSAGMLVYLGGVQQEGSDDGNDSKFSPMDQIQLFDVGSQKWYAQNTSGTAPHVRRSFCAGVTWADDESSYNIYVYGGTGSFGDDVDNSEEDDDDSLSDTWVLSLPAFEWIQYSTNNQTSGPKGQSGTTCNVYAGSQMIVTGGRIPAGNDVSCDVPELSNARVLALNDAGWNSLQPSSTTYEVPAVVTAAIGGGTTGGATLRTPSAGWGTNSDLATYFSQTDTATRTATRSVPSSTSTSSSHPLTNNHRPSSTSPGTIAGAVIGSVLGLLGLLSLALLCSRRRMKKSREHHRQSSFPPPAPPMAPAVYVSDGGGRGDTGYQKYTRAREDALKAVTDAPEAVGAVGAGTPRSWLQRYVAGVQRKPVPGKAMAASGAPTYRAYDPLAQHAELPGTGTATGTATPVVVHEMS